MKRSKIGLLCLMIGLATLCNSCSEEDLVSHVPTFSYMAFNPTAPHVGQTITATCVQSHKGSLLDRTTYAWSYTVNGQTTDVNSATTNYGVDNSDPFIRFTPTEAGNYSITVTIRYNLSAKTDGTSGSYTIPDGTVSYQNGTLVSLVTITKKFNVLE